MALSVNQFAQTPVRGQVDLQVPGQVLTGQIGSGVATPLVAGDAVKLENTAGGVPKLLPITSNTDGIFGFIGGNIKDASYAALAYAEISMDGAVMFMQANAAIARGASVEYDYATGNVLTAAGVNPVIGIALDKAAALNDLIRVMIKVPGVSSNASRTITVTATLAEINAGKVLIPGVSGKQITVTNFVERVVGAFAAGTSVNLQSDATAVNVEATAEAGLTNGAVLGPFSANVTLGAGFAAPLPAGEGVKVVNVGAAQTTATSIIFTITFNQR